MKTKRPRRVICPICGAKTHDTGGKTTNGRTIYACGDAGRPPRSSPHWKADPDPAAGRPN